MNNVNYGKLENGILTFSPANLIIGEEQVFNATAEEYLAAGYVPIEYAERPVTGEWQAVYTEVDGKIQQSWVYQGKVHDHTNLDILNSVTEKSLSGMPVVHTLPTDAKDGDMCLYSPANTLTLEDSDKRIYFDWESVLNSPETQGTVAYVAGSTVSNSRIQIMLAKQYIGDLTCEISVTYDNGMALLNMNIAPTGSVSGMFVTNIDGQEHVTELTNISDIPTYLDLPDFDVIAENHIDGNLNGFYTDYRLMYYRAGKWHNVEDILEIDTATDKIELSITTATLKPNTDYSFSEVAELTVEFADGTQGKRNEYMFSFTSGETATVLTLPSSVQWMNELTVEANKRYEISVVDNIGLWCAVDLAVSE